MSNTNFNQIYKGTKKKVKLSFLNSIIKNDADLQSKFLLHIMVKEKPPVVKLMTSDEFKNEIDVVSKEIVEFLEGLDPDYADYENEYSYGHYKPHWEILEEAVSEEIKEGIGGYVSAYLTALESGHLDDAMSTVLGLLKGINKADFSDLENYCDAEFEIYYGFKDELDIVLKTIESTAFETKSITNVLNLSFDYLENTYENTGVKQVIKDQDRATQIMDGWLFAFAKHDNCDIDAIQSLIKNYPKLESLTPSLFAYLLSKKSDKTEWLSFAYNNFKTNEIIAKELIDYLKVNVLSGFVAVANVLIDIQESYWVGYLEDHVTQDMDIKLYLRIQTYLVISNKDIERYKRINRLMTDEQKDDFIDTIRNYELLVAICEVEQKYEKVMTVSQGRHWPDDLIILTKAIIHIYPDFCFNRLSLDIEKSLEEKMDRDNYASNVTKMKLMMEIPSYEVKTKVFIAAIAQKYNRRPALKDEMKKGGVL